MDGGQALFAFWAEADEPDAGGGVCGGGPSIFSEAGHKSAPDQRIWAVGFSRNLTFLERSSEPPAQLMLAQPERGGRIVEKGPTTTMKLGSTGMSTSHWCAIIALWFAPGTREGHGTAQSARRYSFQSRILPTRGATKVGYLRRASGTLDGDRQSSQPVSE